MRLIERESGLEGLVVRPLSARVLPKTVPERRGWVDRSTFEGITGRSRRPQIRMAEVFGLADYPCPSGGCRLTDPGFAGRMKDLLDHGDGIGLRDAKLLRIGRHFRLGATAKAIVARDEEECGRLLALAREGDTVLECAEHNGPTTLLVGRPDPGAIDVAAQLTAGHGQGKASPAVEVIVSW